MREKDTPYTKNEHPLRIGHLHTPLKHELFEGGEQGLGPLIALPLSRGPDLLLLSMNVTSRSILDNPMRKFFLNPFFEQIWSDEVKMELMWSLFCTNLHIGFVRKCEMKIMNIEIVTTDDTPVSDSMAGLAYRR